MVLDWVKFLAAVIPAGVSAGAAIAGNRARQKGQQLSRETIDAALKEALGAYAQSRGMATDINNWALSSSFAPLNFGYQQSRADLQNALGIGSQLLQGGQGQISDILSPYTGAGRRGSEETQFLLYGQRPGAAPAPNRPSALPFPPQGGVVPNALAGGFNIPPPPSSQPAAAGAANTLGAFAPRLADNRVESSGLASTLGPLVGGPAGGLTGGLVSRLTRRGREKTAASDAVNEHSDWFWNEVVPTAQREGWSGDQLKQAADSGWKDYSNWVNQNLKDKTVAERSLASQKEFFDAGLKSNPYTSQFYK